MIKYKKDRQRALVREAVSPVIKKNIKLLCEMRRPKFRADYRDLSGIDYAKRIHKPDIIHRVCVLGEFEVVSSYINEGREKKYPPTLDTKITIDYIKAHYMMKDTDVTFHPVYYSKKDKIAYAIMVYFEDNVELHIHEEPLHLLDDMFKACGYFRSATDKVYYEKTGGVGIRAIQYEAYHYDGHKKLTVPDISYHVTVRENKDSILTNGLLAVSKENADKFCYPPRVFLFTKLKEELLVDYMYKSNKISVEHKDENEVSIFYIKTGELRNTMKFYSDPLFLPKQSMYTYDDITVNYIDKCVDVLF